MDIQKKKNKCKILIPSASWGSPIIATLNEEKYSDIHIVDVQQAVLNVCEDIFNDYVDKPFRKLSGIKPPYNLKTFCVPSENMTEVIDNNYDTVFFCPPYYDLELYGGSDLQSTTFAIFVANCFIEYSLPDPTFIKEFLFKYFNNFLSFLTFLLIIK